MDNNVRSIYGAYLQTCALLGFNVDIKPNSTLNQKFDLFPNEIFNSGETPTVKYLTIGNGGHTASMGVDGLPLINPVPHSPRHAALYNHLPFIIREVTEDLTPGERLLYRLRVPRTIDGVNYMCYYAKVLDLSMVEPKIELRNNTDGIITATDFTPSLADLNPVKPVIPVNGNITSTGNYLASTAKIEFVMNEAEITELLNACNIIYGSDNYAFISEIGLCSGVDRSLMGNFGGPPSAYTEAVGVQIMNFISTAIPAYALSTSITQTIDVGSTSPLLFN
jgi:hypothetical protein